MPSLLPPRSSTVILQTPASWDPLCWQSDSSVDHLWEEQRVPRGGRVGLEWGNQSIPGCPPSQAFYWHWNYFSLLIPALVHAPGGCFCSACAYVFIYRCVLEKSDTQDVIMVWLDWHLRGTCMIGSALGAKSCPDQGLFVPWVLLETTGPQKVF